MNFDKNFKHPKMTACRFMSYVDHYYPYISDHIAQQQGHQGYEFNTHYIIINLMLGLDTMETDDEPYVFLNIRNRRKQTRPYLYKKTWDWVVKNEELIQLRML